MGDGMTYTERIRNLREDMDLTQQVMANKLGVSQRTYSYYENGRLIPVDILIKLADIFEVSLNYMLCRDNKR